MELGRRGRKRRLRPRKTLDWATPDQIMNTALASLRTSVLRRQLESVRRLGVSSQSRR